MDSNRIAKNAFLLYFRMFITLLVSLFTSRVILLNLGVVDYGVYNVVSSVVTIFLFLNGALSEATQRFIVYEIGKENKDKVHLFFVNSINLHLLISILVVFLCETIGIWLLNYKLEIPLDRRHAAMWVYQISVLTSVIGIMSVPYNAIIISYEKMGAFAYISVVEVILKLFTAYLISVVTWDRLILYSVLLCVVQLTIRVIYCVYCSRAFEVAHYTFKRDKEILKEMISFSSWYLMGHLSIVMNNQGSKIILNMFFGPIVNAALGIAEQIQSALGLFRVNFQIAINPQITKNFAQEKLFEMKLLICSSTKFTYFIFWIIAIPIVFHTNTILHLWLSEVPEHTVVFTRLLVIIALIQALDNPLVVSIGAIGKLRKITIFQSLLSLLVIPISFLLLKTGYSIIAPLCCYIIFMCINYLINFWFLNKTIGLDLSMFIHFAWQAITFVSILSLLTSLLLMHYVYNFFINISLMFLINTLLIYFWGLRLNEKKFILNIIKKRR